MDLLRELHALECECRLFEAARVDSKATPAAMRTEQARYRARLEGALEDFRAGRIDGRQLADRWSGAVLEAYPRAYQVGASSWGAALDDADRHWLRGAVQEEQRFIRAFASQIENETTRMNVDRRLDMYVSGLDGPRQTAWVEKAPDDSIIFWRRSPVESCADCLLLESQNPYRKHTLPTTPRSGSTVCRTNCKCFLEIQSAPERAAPERPARVDSVSDFSRLSSRTGREVTAEERSRVDDLRAEINYQRRMIAQATTPEEKKAAIAARKAANAELNDLIASRGLRDVPMRSVGEVIEGTDVSPVAVNDLLLGGLDGPTLAGLRARDWEAATAALREEIVEILGR